MAIRSGLDLHVVGAGLLGTSLALASKERGYSVTIEDLNPDAEVLARDLIKNHASVDTGNADLLVVVAVPPLQTPSEVSRSLARHKDAIVIDVASVKTNIQHEVKQLSDNWRRFVPTHPIAGREVGGTKSAQADLFRGRAWVLSPYRETDPTMVARVVSFIESLGASPYLIDAHDHDRLFAKISHVPQLVSSALASLLDRDGNEAHLAGQGLRDVTRLADSDPILWREIIASNQEAVLDVLRAFKEVIEREVASIEGNDHFDLEEIFLAGKRGRQAISGKHGAQPRDYVSFNIVIDDRPGVLGELFSLMAEHGINVEDLNIEHSPNQETGLISVSVNPEDQERTVSALQSRMWIFHMEKKES